MSIVCILRMEKHQPKPVPDDPEIMRIFKADLQGLDKLGRECEVCSGHVPMHEWADMDRNGFIVNCPHNGYTFET